MSRPTPHDARNEAIEGLRGLSALLVVLFHVHEMAVGGGLIRPSPACAPIDKLGPFGVMVFFIISGYLITQSLARHGKIGRFLWNRVIRIYPVFLVLHLLLFAVGPVVGYSWMGGLRGSVVAYSANFLSNLFLLPGVFPLPIAQKNAWSLSFEFAFYLISCLYFASASLRGTRRGAAGWGLLALALALTATALYAHPDASFFAVGVAVYFAERRRGSRVSLPLGGLVGLGLMFGFYRVCLPLSMLSGFVFFAATARREGLLSRFLEAPPLVFLGKISYSLYLTHPIALAVARAVVARLDRMIHFGSSSLAVFAALGLALAVGLALLSYLSIEKTLTGVLKRLGNVPPAGERSGRPRARLLDRRPSEAKEVNRSPDQSDLVAVRIEEGSFPRPAVRRVTPETSLTHITRGH